MDITFKNRLHAMSESPLLAYSSWSLLGANLFLGIVTTEWINVAIAISGALVTIAANLDRVAVSVIRIRQLWRNNWKLPNEQTPSAPAEQPDNNNEGNG